LGTRDLGTVEYDVLINSDKKITTNDDSTENLSILLKRTYVSNKVKFFEWLVGKKLTGGYIKSLKSVLESTLNLKYSNHIELKDAILKVKNKKYCVLVMRNLINFFEEYELLDLNLILKIKGKIKVTSKSNIDNFVLNDIQIKDFLSKVNNLFPNEGLRIGAIRAHISSHCVANISPSSNRLRYLIVEGNFRRLYLDSDEIIAHVERIGNSRGQRTKPEINDIPHRYLDLYNKVLENYDYIIVDGDKTTDEYKLEI